LVRRAGEHLAHGEGDERDRQRAARQRRRRMSWSSCGSASSAPSPCRGSTPCRRSGSCPDDRARRRDASDRPVRGPAEIGIARAPYRTIGKLAGTGG
jgi:hypothetical protein